MRVYAITIKHKMGDQETIKTVLANGTGPLVALSRAFENTDFPIRVPDEQYAVQTTIEIRRVDEKLY